ncbi:MAG: class I SAM-dependent methyltransferase [Bacteroidales bacterium]
MKRKGIHKPTIEDAIEIGGIEILHPGGFELTKRTAELCDLKSGMKVLDVSSGRGTQAVFYAKTFGVTVTGLDISEEMISTATKKAEENKLGERVKFILGDSQYLPFADNTFDVVINECAVGIPDDSQKVIDEMLRVVKPNGAIAIHESTWRKPLSDNKKNEISERYGTTPLEFEEWKRMLEKAGTTNIISEFEQWSKPEMFWDIRKDRKVKSYKKVMTVSEKIVTAFRIYKVYGFKGVYKVFENEKKFFQTVLKGELGYALFKGIKKGNVSIKS